MILLRLFLFFVSVEAWVNLPGCLEKQKQCIEYPSGCLGQGCFFIYSSIIKGDYMEVEIRTMFNGAHYAAAAYSFDNKKGMDYLLFCKRNFTSDDMWDGSEFESGRLEVELLESIENYDAFYCKFRHLVQPLKDMMNKIDQPTILMPEGVEYPRSNPTSWTPIGKVDLESTENEETLTKQRWERLIKRLETLEEVTDKLFQTSAQILVLLDTRLKK